MPPMALCWVPLESLVDGQWERRRTLAKKKVKTTRERTQRPLKKTARVRTQAPPKIEVIRWNGGEFKKSGRKKSGKKEEEKEKEGEIQKSEMVEEV